MFTFFNQLLHTCLQYNTILKVVYSQGSKVVSTSYCFITLWEQKQVYTNNFFINVVPLQKTFPQVK